MPYTITGPAIRNILAAMPVTKVDGHDVPCDIDLVASICALVRKWEIE